MLLKTATQLLYDPQEENNKQKQFKNIIDITDSLGYKNDEYENIPKCVINA